MSTAIRKPDLRLLDRVPPYSEDAERAVLGAILLNPEAIGSAIEILHGEPSDLFYFPGHAHIYDAMLGLYRDSRPVDALTLRERLMAAGRLEDIGGLAYIADLSSVVPTSANIAHYARIVSDKAILRGMISCGTSMVANAYDAPADVTALLDQTESDLFRLAERRQTNPVESLGALLPAAVSRIEEAMTLRSGCSGIATGIPRLDNLTSGFQPADMIVLAARPSVGKSAYALSVAGEAAVNYGRGVLFFSLEMSKASLVQRLLCTHAHVDFMRLRTGFLSAEELARIKTASDDLQGAPIYIDDTPGITAMELRAKARRHAARHELGLIVVDYLQLMAAHSRKHENRQSEVSEISRHIKGIARELNVATLALSQLNREADADGGKPKLSNLRESGAIEQDADVVILLSRERPKEGQSPTCDILNFDLAKQRNGPTGIMQVAFEKKTQRFTEVATVKDAARAPEVRAPYVDGPYGDDEEPF